MHFALYKYRKCRYTLQTRYFLLAFEISNTQNAFIFRCRRGYYTLIKIVLGVIFLVETKNKNINMKRVQYYYAHTEESQWRRRVWRTGVSLKKLCLLRITALVSGMVDNIIFIVASWWYVADTCHVRCILWSIIIIYLINVMYITHVHLHNIMCRYVRSWSLPSCWYGKIYFRLATLQRYNYKNNGYKGA